MQMRQRAARGVAGSGAKVMRESCAVLALGCVSTSQGESVPSGTKRECRASWEASRRAREGTQHRRQQCPPSSIPLGRIQQGCLLSHLQPQRNAASSFFHNACRCCWVLAYPREQREARNPRGRAFALRCVAMVSTRQLDAEQRGRAPRVALLRSGDVAASARHLDVLLQGHATPACAALLLDAGGAVI